MKSDIITQGIQNNTTSKLILQASLKNIKLKFFKVFLMRGSHDVFFPKDFIH